MTDYITKNSAISFLAGCLFVELLQYFTAPTNQITENNIIFENVQKSAKIPEISNFIKINRENLKISTNGSQLNQTVKISDFENSWIFPSSECECNSKFHINFDTKFQNRTWHENVTKIRQNDFDNFVKNNYFDQMLPPLVLNNPR